MADKQMVLKPETVVIFCDHREKDVSEILKKMCLVKKVNLEFGDFVCSERVAIERKSYDDFLSSIIDGRLFDQAKKMRENFDKPIILIEGFSNKQINENSVKGAIASLVLDFDVNILSTRNEFDTAKTIYWIAKKEQEEKKLGIAFKVGKKPKDLNKIREFIVSSIPGISTVLSRRLLKEFGSVERVFTANEKELTKIKGIGEKLAKKIRDILTQNYEVKS
ncbi:MAG: helix-hairpin-helix domain-containing protein [Candidatus Aenigmarchaeota archaeon]|nr:helix-hairpin-helix domain-containing protein [Candidatus Aenigmarchaeota archaeon]